MAFGIIQLDDPTHIFENPSLNPVTWDAVVKFWKAPFFELYIPFTYTVWCAVASFAGPPQHLDPAYFHALNLLLHALNGSLVFLVLRRLTRCETFFWPLIGALFFALHPVQVEAVAWISGAKDVLSGALALGAILCYLDDKRRASLLLFILAMLAKPSTLVVPALLLAVELTKESRAKKPWLDALESLWPWFLSTIPILILTKYLQPDSMVTTRAAWYLRPVVALDALGFYLFKLVAPFHFTIDYGRNPITVVASTQVFFTWVLPVAVGLTVWRFREAKLWRLPALLFLIGVAPVLGIIPFAYQKFSTVSDRYLYLSMLGAGLAVALMGELSLPRWGKRIGIGLATGLALLSVHQTYFWRNSIAVLEHNVELNPESLMARTNLGFSYMAEHRFGEASVQFTEAVRRDPTASDLHGNLGSSLIMSGQGEAGLKELREALRLKPNSGPAHYNLGLACLKMGLREEGQFHMKEAGRILGRRF